MVLVSDETRVEFEAKEDRIWAPKGDYPKVEFTGERIGHCFYGATDIFTGKHIIKDATWMDSGETVKFLEKVKKIYQKGRILKPKRKVLLIWDGAPHHRGEVKQFLKWNNDWLELMYFSAYSPELNPEEWMWRKAKKEVARNHEEYDFKELAYKFYKYLVSHELKPDFCRKILAF